MLVITRGYEPNKISPRDAPFGGISSTAVTLNPDVGPASFVCVGLFEAHEYYRYIHHEP